MNRIEALTAAATVHAAKTAALVAAVHAAEDDANAARRAVYGAGADAAKANAAYRDAVAAYRDELTRINKEYPQ